jgi:hypothetical protein
VLNQRQQRRAGFMRNYRQQGVSGQDGDEVVERSHGRQAARDLAFGLEVAQHHPHHPRRGSDGPHATQQGQHVGGTEPQQGHTDEGEAQHGGSHDGGQQPFFAAQPADVDVAAQLIHHQCDSDVGKNIGHAQHVAGQPVQAATAEDEADDQITRDARHPWRLRNDMTGYQPEQQ